jgi:hypothetical protein
MDPICPGLADLCAAVWQSHEFPARRGIGAVAAAARLRRVPQARPLPSACLATPPAVMSGQPEYRPTSPFPIHWLLLGGAATYMLSKRPEKGAAQSQSARCRCPLRLSGRPDGVWGCAMRPEYTASPLVTRLLLAGAPERACCLQKSWR